MFSYLREIFSLLGEDRRKLPLLIFLFICTSILDIAGLGLIGPYIGILVNSLSLDGRLGYILSFLGFNLEPQSLLITLGIALFFIFLLKSISGILIHWLIIKQD